MDTVVKHCINHRGNTAESITKVNFKDTDSGHRGRTVDDGQANILGGAGD